ncbi:hypothetical protein ACPPVU_04410 [Mucilaginibacter sp. McL0603]|uniref:hypothetical protein n=1 Tax=Mucilaginibacter sp. McL0603 TaxID=3415670 RepID=UPI003CED33BA
MKTPFFITLLLLFSSLLIKAQDNQHVQSKPDSIIKLIPVGEGKHTSYLYTIGGKLQTREDVLIRLMRYEPSAVEISKAKNTATWGYVSFAGAGVSGIVATILYATHNSHAGETVGLINGQPEFIYQHHSLAGAYILTGVATGLLTAAFINLANSGKHTNKALKLYNSQYQ